MIVLGLVVGHRNSAVDEWFFGASYAMLGGHPTWMLALNRAWLLVSLLVLTVGIALWRRQWRLAVVAGLCPVVSIAGSRTLKVLFGRPWSDDALAYPSGHTTVAITVLAMLVLVIGIRVWTVAVASVAALVPSIGMASNYFHYFTDIIGGVLYATSMVCLAVLAAGPDALARSLGRPRSD